MTTQISIDDLLKEQDNGSKRLVDKYYMTTLEWEVYNEFKRHLTKENAISAYQLSEMFMIDTRQLRDVITTLRNKMGAKIIGDVNGYYIGTKEEFELWIISRMKRTLTSMKTTLDLYPGAKNLMYWFLNGYDNKGIAQGQQQLQFNGWEREFIRQFAEDYLKPIKE